MARLLFRLNQAPEDEARAIRELLDEHRIAFYETSAGMLGISVAAIWLSDEADWDQAKALVDDYQQQRAEQLRREQAELVRRGEHDTFFKKLQREPFKIVLYLVAAGAIVYLSLMPFFELY